MKKLKIILILIFYHNSFPQTTWEPYYNLSNASFATSDYHSVYSENFDFAVVWGENGEIKFRRSDFFGSNWFPKKNVSNTQNTCGWPVVSGFVNNYYVLYHTLVSGGNYEIIFQKTTNGGDTWSKMKKISGSASAITPQIFLKENVLYAVWEERPNNNYEIYFSKSTDQGETWSVPQNISNTPTTSRWVQLQMGFNNILYCAWIETTTYPASDIYFTKSTDLGATWSTPLNITNDERPQNRIYMTLDQNNSNKIYIASDDIITFNFNEIYLLKSSDAGNTWSTGVNITNNAGNSNTPSILVFEDNIKFTWSDNTHSAPNYDNSDIFYKWSSDGGNTWSEAVNLSLNLQTSSRPRICYGWHVPIEDVFGLKMTIVWYDYSFGASEILARNGLYKIVPVELSSFTANVNDNNIILNWTTSSETNNFGFEIQRSVVSVQQSVWEVVGFVEGNGTTTETYNYLFEDNNLSELNGKYLYRLKQIDFDGSFEYSNIIEIEIGVPVEFSLSQNYPNPFNPSTEIRFQIAEDSKVSLIVYDIIGNEVAVLLNEQKPPGTYEIKWNAENLSSGIYYYNLSAGNFADTKKMILVK